MTTETSYIKLNEERITGLVKSYVETIFWSTLLKERYKGRQDEEEDVSSHEVTLSKREILEIEEESIISHSL